MVSTQRESIRTARSLVVKVGTTALTTPSGVFDAGALAGLTEAIEARMKAGTDVVIVSSGAIAAGIEPLVPYAIRGAIWLCGRAARSTSKRWTGS